ncbi:MAG: hypothetical protein AAGG81_04440 [Chlamydiota bacterium]
MHKNKIWLIFLGAITLVVIWFCWGTVDQFTHYYSLKAKVSVHDIHWQILKIGDEDYQIQAEYTFEYEGGAYSSLQLFEKTVFPNLWAAEYRLEKMKAKKWVVWFNPDNPKVSSLTKGFPLKQALSAIVLLGLWLYFVWLGFYVTQFRN